MTTYSNVVVSGVPMRAKLGGPESGGESKSAIGDIKHAHFLWLTKEQKRALPKGVGIGSRVTVRFPSIGKSVKGELVRQSSGTAMVNFDEQLDLTSRQARIVKAAKNTSAVRK